MKYTDEEIRRNSEAAEALFNPQLPFSKKGDKYSSDEFADLGPVQIPCRRGPAENIINQFDKPEDLTTIADETPNGKRLGTKIIVHKKHERLIRRHLELTIEVFKEAGFIIGDENNDKFIPLEVMRACQAEAMRRLQQEFR